ncbi:YcgL domain-containing protein [Aliidiomarina indica]|uniref:YcgL domain-containing protein n=1 Tax=Aliidiomarina indica TaxID=2749147 RepID=UPI00188E9ABD|nr:YcgL domain-containing protein [Aliidiomarina indica]
MLCRILRSPRKADTYLFIPADALVSELPDTLQTLFTPEHEVTRLLVTPERKFARLDGVKLLEHLSTEGYYLQIPPPPVNMLATLND